MLRSSTAASVLIGLLVLAGCGRAGPARAPAEAASDAAVLRVATYNLEDVRGGDLDDPRHPRLRALAAVIQQVRPDVLLLNEIAYDQPGAPGYEPGARTGRNAQRFADLFLAVSQGPGLAPLAYDAFSAPTNTGLASGFDLDDSGRAVTEVPPVPPAGPGGAPGEQTDAGRAYGNDAWGFGTFPGQYGMALLVREGLDVVEEDVRTFRLLRWSRMPGAVPPADPDTDAPFYEANEWRALRLSSKSHWDVPVALPGGRVLHVLASHPTPPAFDGPERRNHHRNRDEIRFWADYLDGADYVVDDSSAAGGLAPGASFVILGDLNADPDEGDALGNPVQTFLLSYPRIDGGVVPLADAAGRRAYPDLDPDDTARWGLRVDYVLPSDDLSVLDAGVRRPTPDEGPLPSDHFMVWIDVGLPAPERPSR